MEHKLHLLVARQASKAQSAKRKAQSAKRKEI